MTQSIDQLILIGASTGGPDALKHLIEQLPEDIPPALVVLHIPAGFSETFANRINKTSRVTVMQGEEGQRIEAGHVYIAPGDQHMRLERFAGRLQLSMNQGEKVNSHRPSYEVLFHSVSHCFDAARCSVVMLTGMGKDGSAQVAAFKRQGAFTIAQDEATSVVWGMPGEVVRLSGASVVLPLQQIPNRLMQNVRQLRSVRI